MQAYNGPSPTTFSRIGTAAQTTNPYLLKNAKIKSQDMRRKKDNRMPLKQHLFNI